jgi:hypothetical protein
MNGLSNEEKLMNLGINGAAHFMEYLLGLPTVYY